MHAGATIQSSYANQHDVNTVGLVFLCVCRGSKEASRTLAHLCQTAEGVCGVICKHMQHEEVQLLPLLEAHLTPGQQRTLVWHTLR